MQTRRELFPILGAAAVGAQAAPPAAYAPRVFDAAQFACLGELCEMIIPADETSIGAREAGAPVYIDTTLFHAPAAARAAWLEGIVPFVSFDNAQRLSRLTELAAGGDAFFATLKRMTVEGWMYARPNIT